MTPICLDFDGTVVTHEYPRVGKDIGAVPWLLEAQEAGAQLVLFTMRSGDQLADAVLWFANNGVKLHGINANPDQKSWTSSPKAYGHLYIDDAALGAPLSKGQLGERPYIDWSVAGPALLDFLK